MSALQSELNRLYWSAGAPGQPKAMSGDGTPPALGDAPVRVLVLELSHPAEWSVVARLWQGVQADFGLPAPAIAVNGVDAYQLWFSLAEPVDLSDGHTFLSALQSHYWPEIDPARVRAACQPVRPVPALQKESGYWSAFVTPDLAAIFSGDPWLEMEPNPDAQAQVLSRLRSVTAQDRLAALQKLKHAAPEPPAASARETPRHKDPGTFLREVMNDPSVPMALRIEAAKALLPQRGLP